MQQFGSARARSGKECPGTMPLDQEIDTGLRTGLEVNAERLVTPAAHYLRRVQETTYSISE